MRLALAKPLATQGSRNKRQQRLRCSQGVVRGGVEPPTFRFSGGRSYQLSYLTLAGADTGRRLRSEPGATDPSGPDGI